jgi:hypothetical protein
MLHCTEAESAIVNDGARLLALRSGIFTSEWDLTAQTLATRPYQRTAL